MAVPSARRAVALYQVGENDFTGPELNHAFVDNNEALRSGHGGAGARYRRHQCGAARQRKKRRRRECC
jgi:hypothetical protein